MPTERVLTPSAILEVKRLYELREKGRRIHSHRSIGKLLGVSETTVLRALEAQGAYMGTETLTPKTDAAMTKAAQASVEKLKDLLGGGNGPDKAGG